MKKRDSLYLIVLLLWIGMSFAQTWPQNPQEQFETVKQMNYLNQVGVYFVNPTTKATPKEYNVMTDQEKREKLTLLFKNESDKDLHVRIEFADQVESNAWTRWCSADYKNWFSAFIKAPRKGDILLPAKSQTEKDIQLEFPVGVKGIQKWCIAYGVMEDKEKNAKTFLSIVTRKVLYLDALVGWTGEVDYRIVLWSIDKYINDKGELEISMDAQNVWNVDSTISIEWKIGNILGFEKPIAMGGKIIKGEEGTLMTNMGRLPFYKWMFTIKLTIKDTPDFGFDGSKYGIDPKILAWWERTITILYFVWHRWMMIVLLIPVMIIYGTSKRKKKLS